MEPVTYLHLPASAPPPPLKGPRPFKAVVVVEQDVTEAWQDVVSEWLVHSGCRYMMAWGRDCASWDDSVDLANLRQFDFDAEAITGEAYVMTTWHDDEPLNEVLWFCAHVAFHPTLELDTVIVDISAAERRAELLEAYRLAENDEA